MVEGCAVRAVPPCRAVPCRVSPLAAFLVLWAVGRCPPLPPLLFCRRHARSSAAPPRLRAALSPSRFESLLLDDHGLHVRRTAAQIFRSFDPSAISTGVVPAARFPDFHAQLVSNHLTRLPMEQCKADLDSNNDGKIQFNELVEWLARTQR